MFLGLLLLYAHPFLLLCVCFFLVRPFLVLGKKELFCLRGGNGGVGAIEEGDEEVMLSGAWRQFQGSVCYLGLSRLLGRSVAPRSSSVLCLPRCAHRAGVV